MRLRPLTSADAPHCAELEKVLFPGESPWPARAFEQEIAAGHTTYWAVDMNVNRVGHNDNRVGHNDNRGEVLGYAGVGRMGPAAWPEYEIRTIGVDPAAQRRGIARLMMDAIVELADSHDAPIFLEVRVGNEPAIRLYEAYDFVINGLRRNYYQPSGADAHTMYRPRKSERC
ncbi:ribosomal-protein-alanine N-acetyltransferase RimI [Corynebacterium sp. HMSC074C01]|uniref:GNAT acetyltransferase n=1 Tax=Corynebacterium aurimucosum (strain ATCC 700975 / DSM 44827 / CIP 107346 / CN-1) TaxID=548476 RepID=C3PL60_CORA7|nr:MULTISPECIES: GNAT family N-acetyltransferase [Corynebacterium]ACP32064.1 GNAT acetyltransferase [Corynebacterium aurimucosum ATCC 700975]OFP63337.1 ribosomal-protein-alanine N-acetyltransferase RimI [Corynebacterium sp. HMSC074C01]QQU93735.1 GNAT family N-acetyltransferase [Corynebacterium aurimucosum]